jgi:hypothetical protein
LLIPCSQELVGSNPTPRAYLGILYEIIKRKNTTISNSKNNLSKTTLKKSLFMSNKAQKDKASYNPENQKNRAGQLNELIINYIQNEVIESGNIIRIKYWMQ